MFEDYISTREKKPIELPCDEALFELDLKQAIIIVCTVIIIVTFIISNMGHSKQAS